MRLLFSNRIYRQQTGALVKDRFITSRTRYSPIRTYVAPQPRPYTPPKPKPAPVPLQAVISPRKALPESTSQSLINPPSSTLPPSLDVPTRSPDLPTYKYLFGLGRAYASFYKTGLKAIWTNFRTAQSLPEDIFSANRARLYAAVRDGTLSRANFQLVKRTRNDIRRVPPFALLFCICGEFTPLVIVFVSSLVPRIIWIPRQVEKAREKAQARRRGIPANILARIKSPISSQDLSLLPSSKQDDAYRGLAQSLGLYPQLWDRWIPGLIPMSLVRRNVKRKMEELETDDIGIQQCGGVGKLEAVEVEWACEERGIDVLGKEDGVLRRELGEWMERRRRVA